MTNDVPMPPGPFTGSDAWLATDFADNDSWVYRLSPEHILEIEDAVRHITESRIALENVRRDDVPLPTLGPLLKKILNEVLWGRGFALIRGMPVDRLGKELAAVAFWALGVHLGKAVPQNAKGHLLGHVRDLGHDPRNPHHRIYETTAKDVYHADGCDVVGLLCLCKAKTGGLSEILSSVSLYNAMRARRPDLAAVLFRSFVTDRRGEIPEGALPYYRLPVFSYFDGRLSTYYTRNYVESARRFPEVPPLTETEVAAFDLFDSLCEDPKLNLKMAFEPGDIQLLHNYQILHNRTAFEDWPEPERKRHLLRLWLCTREGRQLAPSFAERFGSVEVGNRGGIWAKGARLHVPLAAT